MVPNPVLSSEHQTHISSLLLDILNWLFSEYFKCNRFTGNTLSSFHPPPTPLAYSDLFHFRTWTISFQSILLFWRRNKTVILACPKQSNGFPLYTRWSQNFLCPMSNIRLTYPLQPHLLLFPVHSKFKYSTHIHSNYAQLLVDLPTWGSIIASAFTWYFLCLKSCTLLSLPRKFCSIFRTQSWSPLWLLPNFFQAVRCLLPQRAFFVFSELCIFNDIVW